MIRKKKVQDSSKPAHKKNVKNSKNPFGGRRMLSGMDDLSKAIESETSMSCGQQREELTETHNPDVISKKTASLPRSTDDKYALANKVLSRSALTRHHACDSTLRDGYSEEHPSHWKDNSEESSEPTLIQPGSLNPDQGDESDRDTTNKMSRSRTHMDKRLKEGRRMVVLDNVDDNIETSEDFKDKIHYEQTNSVHFSESDIFKNAYSSPFKANNTEQFKDGGLGSKAYAALKYFLTLSADFQRGYSVDTEKNEIFAKGTFFREQLAAVTEKFENGDVNTANDTRISFEKKQTHSSNPGQSTQKYHVRREKIDCTGDGSEKAYVIHVECESHNEDNDETIANKLQSRRRRGDFARVRQMKEGGQQRSLSLNSRVPGTKVCRASKSNDCLQKAHTGQQSEHRESFPYAIQNVWAATKEGTPILRHYPKQRRHRNGSDRKKSSGASIRLIDHLERKEQLESETNDHSLSAMDGNGPAANVTVKTTEDKVNDKQMNNDCNTEVQNKQNISHQAAKSECGLSGLKSHTACEINLKAFGNQNSKSDCLSVMLVERDAEGLALDCGNASRGKMSLAQLLGDNCGRFLVQDNLNTRMNTAAALPGGEKVAKSSGLPTQSHKKCSEIHCIDTEQGSESDRSSLTVTFVNNKMMEDKGCQYSPPRDSIAFDMGPNISDAYNEFGGQNVSDVCDKFDPQQYGYNNNQRANVRYNYPKNNQSRKPTVYENAAQDQHGIVHNNVPDNDCISKYQQSPSALSVCVPKGASPGGTPVKYFTTGAIPNMSCPDDAKYRSLLGGKNSQQCATDRQQPTKLLYTELDSSETYNTSRLTHESQQATKLELPAVDRQLSGSTAVARASENKDKKRSTSSPISSESLTPKQAMLLSIALQNESQSNPGDIERCGDTGSPSSMSCLPGTEGFPVALRNLLSLSGPEAMSINMLQSIVEESKARSHINANNTNANKLNINTNADETMGPTGTTVTTGSVTSGGEPVSIFIGEYLQKLWRNQCLCDVEVTVNNEVFLVHKIVLAAFSRVFCPSTPKPPPSIRFTVPNTTPAAVYQIFCYLYTSNMELSDDLLEPVLSAALFMEITEVVDIVQDIVSKPSMENIHMYSKIMERNGLVSSLIDHPQVYQTYFSELRNSDFFLELTVEEMEHLLLDPDVMVNDEVETIESIANWVKYNFLQRIRDLPRLLKLVSFECIPPKILAELTEQYDYLFKTPCGTQFINEAFKFHALKLQAHFQPCPGGPIPIPDPRSQSVPDHDEEQPKEQMWETENEPRRSHADSATDKNKPIAYMKRMSTLGDQARRDSKLATYRENRKSQGSIVPDQNFRTSQSPLPPFEDNAGRWENGLNLTSDQPFMDQGRQYPQMTQAMSGTSPASRECSIFPERHPARNVAPSHGPKSSSQKKIRFSTQQEERMYNNNADDSTARVFLHGRSLHYNDEIYKTRPDSSAFCEKNVCSPLNAKHVNKSQNANECGSVCSDETSADHADLRNSVTVSNYANNRRGIFQNQRKPSKFPQKTATHYAPRQLKPADVHNLLAMRGDWSGYRVDQTKMKTDKNAQNLHNGIGFENLPESNNNNNKTDVTPHSRFERSWSNKNFMQVCHNDIHVDESSCASGSILDCHKQRLPLEKVVFLNGEKSMPMQEPCSDHRDFKRLKSLKLLGHEDQSSAFRIYKPLQDHS